MASLSWLQKVFVNQIRGQNFIIRSDGLNREISNLVTRQHYPSCIRPAAVIDSATPWKEANTSSDLHTICIPSSDKAPNYFLIAFITSHFDSNLC
mmetsp:Transcript_60019/g.131906  ORF Transcript_60019/g.131906 Transcript_60019/m.131906 type:complete len:95 (+) Transcript_60019:566-850(+)